AVATFQKVAKAIEEAKIAGHGNALDEIESALPNREELTAVQRKALVKLIEEARATLNTQSDSWQDTAPDILNKLAASGRAGALPTAVVPADIVHVTKRPPVPFKPLPVLDPATGKPISPSTILTLPDGKKIAAGEFYHHLNQIRKALNADGHRLRDKVAR